MAYYFMLPAADDILLLAVMLLLLIMSAYIGRYLHYYRNKSRAGGVIIITAGTLSLSVLLIGFAFSVSINGFTTLKQAQVREAQTIEKAWQYSLLLPASVQPKAQELLRQYLDQRIHFFRDSSLQGGRSWNQLSEDSQQKLWLLAVSEATHSTLPVMDTLLTAYSELRVSQQQTTAVSQRKLPDTAWLVIIAFAMAACCLTGRLQRQGHSLLVLPVMISLSLFLIAEIDTPGEGIIRVIPDDLEHAAFTLPPVNTGVKHDPTHSVYHAH
ncbi:hypothetical protein [Enterobacter sp. Lyrl_3]|uniref:bestrophin-like domain n=1 Tax=Enterobacter sp. Lyrl_3 TaxID=3110922 RepID=UPI003F805972